MLIWQDAHVIINGQPLKSLKLVKPGFYDLRTAYYNDANISPLKGGNRITGFTGNIGDMHILIGNAATRCGY